MARSAHDDVVTCEARADCDWNDLVRRSPAATVFHREECLAAVAALYGATLHRLVGRRGGEPVGLLPVFSLSKGPVTAAFSPPPGMGLPNLGPVLLPAGDAPAGSVSSRDAPAGDAPARNALDGNAPTGDASAGERSHLAARFLASCREWLRESVAPSYVHVATPTGFSALHAFDRADRYRVRPQFTYVVDLDRGREDLLDSFSSDARNNVRTAEDAPVAVREGGRDAIDRILAHLRRRYDEQGLTYPVSPGFVADLYDRLPEGAVRPYVCTVDGEYAGGMVALADDGAVYRWQGGAKTDADLPVNDYLDWHVMRDAADRGQSRYDLVGANTPGLCEYKSKFNPELETYFRVERGTKGMGLVAGLYRRLRELGFAPKGGFG